MRQLLCLLILIAGLSACSSQPPITTADSEWEQHLSQLQQLEHWQLNGKIAFINQQSRQAANLFWRQDGENSLLRINGPLGLQGVEVHYQPGQVWVKTKDEEYRGNDAQQLIYRLTGWQVPVEQLPAWLLGMPSQNDYQLNAQHRLASFTSAEQWQINYLNYAQYGNYTLPRQLELNSADNRLKLNIHQWQIDDSTNP